MTTYEFDTHTRSELSRAHPRQRRRDHARHRVAAVGDGVLSAARTRVATVVHRDLGRHGLARRARRRSRRSSAGASTSTSRRSGGSPTSRRARARKTSTARCSPPVGSSSIRTRRPTSPATPARGERIAAATASLLADPPLERVQREHDAAQARRVEGRAQRATQLERRAAGPVRVDAAADGDRLRHAVHRRVGQPGRARVAAGRAGRRLRRRGLRARPASGDGQSAGSSRPTPARRSRRSPGSTATSSRRRSQRCSNATDSAVSTSGRSRRRRGRSDPTCCGVPSPPCRPAAPSAIPTRLARGGTRPSSTPTVSARSSPSSTCGSSAARSGAACASGRRRRAC